MTEIIGSSTEPTQARANDIDLVDCEWVDIELARMYPDSLVDVRHWFKPAALNALMHPTPSRVKTQNKMLAISANDACFSRTAT